jgi:hypothetical protein
VVLFESVGHPNQLGIGSRAHFVHGRPAMLRASRQIQVLSISGDKAN